MKEERRKAIAAYRALSTSNRPKDSLHYLQSVTKDVFVPIQTSTNNDTLANALHNLTISSSSKSKSKGGTRKRKLRNRKTRKQKR